MTSRENGFDGDKRSNDDLSNYSAAAYADLRSQIGENGAAAIVLFYMLKEHKLIRKQLERLNKTLRDINDNGLACHTQ